MPEERRQFRVLYRDFLFRMVDLELLSAHGEIGKLLAQFAAMLAAFSFVFAITFVPRYVASTLPRARLLVLAWVDEEFLIATTMAVAGLFALLAWNAVLPGRRDSLVLGVLPVRTRTIFLAKVAAIATALGISVAAVNSFTGFCYPFLVGGWRSLGAYWLAQALAGVFVCGALLALQGLLAQCLSYRLFLRVSSWVQLAAFFCILGIYFLKPPFPTGPEPAAASRGVMGWLPSFWFFGLLQKLNGAAEPVFGALAERALWSLAIVLTVAPSTFALAYRRNTRRIIEQPDITPADRSRPAARRASLLAAKLLPRPVERAILLFTARTIARSRQHRLLLAAYGGIGLAIALVYAKDLLYGYSSALWSTVGHARPSVRWDQPGTSLLAASLVLLCFAVIGARAVFALPIALPANWIFRLTAVHRPPAYFAAVRKSLFALAAVPLWIASAILYFAIWPGPSALEHMAMLAATGILLVELSLYRFRKIPFTCSYLPGKANLDVRLGVYGILLVIAADRGVAIEFWAMHSLARSVVLLGILLAAAIWARRRTTAFAASPYNQVQFEDLPADDVNVLDLHRDGGWLGGEAYAGGIDARRLAPVAEPLGRVLFVATVKEPVSVGVFLEGVMRDLRSGARILTRSPGFSAAVVALIALGIGGNTTIYSMIHAVLSKPAPGISADGLVSFGMRSEERVQDPADSFPNYQEYAAQSRSMAAIAASAFERFTLGLRDGAWELRGELVTANYFETLGVRLVKGREFTAQEARGAAPLAAIITDHVWRNQFHGAEDVLGQTVLLNGHPATIVGVGPPEFRGTSFAPNLEICVPLLAYTRIQGRERELRDRSRPRVEIIGRLAEGVSLAQARAEFATISKRLQDAYPEAGRGRRVELRPYSAAAFSPITRGQAQVFMAIVMVVALATLLIVCANVALLLLGRAGIRQRELALRLSLGASRLRILRILLAEGLVLSLIAAAAAWVMAWWVTGAVATLLPPLESGARLQPDLRPDWRVAAYALALAVLATLVFTLAPAVRAWRQQLLPSLKAGEHGVVQRRSRLGSILVTAQLALCVVLLLGGALAYRSLFLIDTTDPGFRKDHLLLAAVNTAGAASGGEQNVALLERIRERLRTVPGVIAASWAIAAPPHSHGWMGRPVQAGVSGQPVRTDGTFAGPEELESLGVPILAGRGIVEADLKRARASAAINQALAESLWPGQSAVGRTMLLEGQPVEVVGIVANGVFSGVAEDGSFAGLGKTGRRNFVFLAEQQRQPGQRTFHVRYRGDLNAIAPAVRAAIREVDSRVPVFSVRTMETEWADFTAPIRMITTLLALFAIGALALASVGLYAVVAFQTARRTRELGIRMALGASPGQAQSAVLKEGLRLTAIGVGGGLALSAAAARAFGSLLFGVTPTDGPTYLAVLGLLAGVSLLACYLPARRAARIDPLQALRQD